MPDDSPTIKKITRAKKISAPSSFEPPTEGVTPKTASLITDFESLIDRLNENKEQVEGLEKEITETKVNWIKEQKQRADEITQQKEQEELQKKRERETYEYETQLSRKKSQDEFTEKKAKWERDLENEKEQISLERKELAELRKKVEAFEEEKEKAVKLATDSLQKLLTDSFVHEKQLTDQTQKSETDILKLKIIGLEAENSRQLKEIETLRKSLNEATQKFESVAVKVIESTRPEAKPEPKPNSSQP